MATLSTGPAAQVLPNFQEQHEKWDGMYQKKFTPWGAFLTLLLLAQLV